MRRKVLALFHYYLKKERCLRLDYLIKKDKIDSKELFRDNLTK